MCIPMYLCLSPPCIYIEAQFVRVHARVEIPDRPEIFMNWIHLHHREPSSSAIRIVSSRASVRCLKAIREIVCVFYGSVILDRLGNVRPIKYSTRTM